MDVDIDTSTTKAPILKEPEREETFNFSPLLNFPSIRAHISTQEIVDIVREGRER